MFKNYIKISLRSLMRNPLNAFINLFGLSVAIGICIFVFGFARWVYSTDQFHVHKNEVHLVTFMANRDGTLQQHGQTPRPLGEMLRKDFAHIEKVCRVEDRNVVVKYADKVFHERVRYTDPEFLEMFTFPLKWGAIGSLQDMNSIILSEEMAIKYFGEENPIGREILIKFKEDKSKVFRITGVAADFPKAHTIEFDFLINFQNLRTTDTAYNFHDWGKLVNATFIQVDHPSSLASIKPGMGKYRILQNEAAEKDWAIVSFAFEPLATLHARSGEIRDYISWSSHDNYKSIIFLCIIGVFMLALACFNYINIAIVSAAKRLKEIGVRKTLGASRKTVIIQFLTENIVVTFFALVVGLVLGISFFIPGFEYLNHFSMGFRLNDPYLWVYLPAVLLFTGIASGSYPAFYISGFQVTGILKGSVKFGQRNPLTKIFIGFQFILACILITAGVMFTQNTNYLANRSWGYNQREALYVSVSDLAAFEKLKAIMMQEPDVLSISGSSHHLGKNNTTTVLHLPNRQFEADQLSVDPNYFQTMGLQLIEGRVFKECHESDKQAIVVNEFLVKSIGLKNPIGQVFKIDSIQYKIIGVTKDFHSYSFFKKVNPTIFRVADKESYRYLSLKVRPGSEHKTYKTLQTQWAKLYPEIPFDGGYQEDVWGRYYATIAVHATVWKVVAFIAVLLASMGLYGLITLNIAGRAKELSIRKILGAGIRSITVVITRQYVVLLTVALVMGAPVSYILMKFMFQRAYSYHMPITFSGVTIAVIILIFVLSITVFTQIRKVLKSNPANGLKVE